MRGLELRCPFAVTRRSYALILISVFALQGYSQDATITALKDLSLEQLSQIEVTTPSKDPTSAFRSPVAIYVLTGEDIRRAGVTTIPDALRLAPGVEVARIDGSKWSVGIRGFGTRLSRSVLVLIDGRSLYASIRRNLLGSAGYAAAGYRSDRGDSGARRNHLGA